MGDKRYSHGEQNGHIKQNDYVKQNGHCEQLEHLTQSENMSNERARFEVSGLKRKKRSGCVARTALVTSSIAVLISLCVFVYVTVVFTRDRQARNQPVITEDQPMSYPEMCIDCLKLVKNPYSQSQPDPLLERLTKRKVNGVSKCCAGNSTQMSALLEAFGREQTAPQVVLRENAEQMTMPDELSADSEQMTIPGAPIERKFSSASVHKHMKSESLEESGFDAEVRNVLKFDPNLNDPLTEHVRGVTVLPNGLVILHSGIYFVYSSVSYRPNSPRSEEEVDNQKWLSYIHLMRPTSASSTGILLQSVHTNCESCHSEFESAFTGGVFHLKAGDFIQVFVSETGLVGFNKESTYLGLVLLGTSQLKKLP